MKTIERDPARIVIAALALFAALVSGCSKDETSPIVFVQSPRTDTGSGPFTSRLSEAQEDTILEVPLSTAAAAVLLAGALPEGFAARAYFKFGTLIDTTQVRPDSISSATVLVLGRDRYGSDTTPLLLHLPAVAWTVSDLEHGGPTGDEIGQFSPGSAPSDTARTRYTAELDTALLRSWLRDPSTNVGLYADASAADAMIRLYSTRVNPSVQTPSLTIRYHSAAKIDSVVRVSTLDAYALTKPAPPADSQTLEIADGWGLRSLLFFDTDSLRAHVPSGATINRARLVLTVVDTSRVSTNLVHGGSVSLAAYAVTSVWSEKADSLELASLTTSTTVAGSTTYKAGAETVSFDIAALVQNWIEGRVANHGLEIRSTAELNDLARITLASRLYADPAKRPRLEFVYSLPPGPRP